MDKPYIAGQGPMGAKILLLGGEPTFEDLKSGKPFTGTRELDYLLKDAGINKHDCWHTYVFKYPLSGNPKIPAHVRAQTDGFNLQKTIEELQNEITAIEPNIIIGIGATALWALKGHRKIGDYRGSILQGMGRKTVCTYNPHHLSWNAQGAEFIGYWNRQIILFDLKRAKEESSYPELNLPSRTLKVCRSAYELEQFLKHFRGYKRAAADIEAHGTMLPACIGLSFDPSFGMTVPLWNAGGLSSMSDSEITQCWIMLDEVLNEVEIVGQNFNYDRDKMKRLGFTFKKFVSDTLLKAFTINPELPKNLGFNTSIHTREPFYKNEGMYHGSIEDLFIGCARDSCVTLEVDQSQEKDLEELGQVKFFYNFVMKLPDLYWGIEQQGFRVDDKQREKLMRKYINWSERLQYELFLLTQENVNVNSPKQVAILLFDVLKCPKRLGTGEEELTSLLNLQSFTDETKRRVVEVILEKRRVDKSIGTYLMALPDFDGRMRTTYFPCLETGRSSTGQQDPPIRPTLEWRGPDGKKKNRVLGTAFQTMTKHGDIGADIRSMYIPDLVIEDLKLIYGPEEFYAHLGETEVFVQADSAQAEARVVFLLANDEQALKDIDEHDYHALTASWFFGGTESDYSKKVLGYESPIRFAGKTLRHAGHLGAGKRRAATELNTQARKYKIPITITERDSEKALKIFHAKQPKIQQVFHSGIIEIVNKSRRLTAGLPYGVDAESGGIRTFFERSGEELNRQSLSYIPQRSVSDNTKAAALRIKVKCPGIKIVMEAHDGLLFCIPRNKLETWLPIIKEEMERPISFHKCSLPRRHLKIPCDIEVGENYEKLKKFKFAFQEKIDELIVDRPLTTTEKFRVLNAGDSYLDNKIYEANEWKKVMNNLD